MDEDKSYESPRIENLDTSQGPLETAAGASGPD